MNTVDVRETAGLAGENGKLIRKDAARGRREICYQMSISPLWAWSGPPAKEKDWKGDSTASGISAEPTMKPAKHHETEMSATK